jgi:hypothetical protein
MKEARDYMKLPLNCINYKKYQWQLCRDLKVVAIFLRLQQGYTKFCTLLCEWYSPAKTSYYKRNRPSRQPLERGTKNVQHLPQVESSNTLLRPLHIEVGLMKNFVKATDQIEQAFRYVAHKFPGISAAKIKEDVFVVPQIRKLFRDEQLDRILSVVTRRGRGMIFGS